MVELTTAKTFRDDREVRGGVRVITCQTSGGCCCDTVPTNRQPHQRPSESRREDHGIPGQAQEQDQPTSDG